MYRHIPFTIITIGVGVLFAATILLVGGMLAGWNVWKMVTSPTAWLVYAALLFVAVVALFKYFLSKDER